MKHEKKFRHSRRSCPPLPAPCAPSSHTPVHMLLRSHDRHDCALVWAHAPCKLRTGGGRPCGVGGKPEAVADPTRPCGGGGIPRGGGGRGRPPEASGGGRLAGAKGGAACPGGALTCAARRAYRASALRSGPRLRGRSSHASGIPCSRLSSNTRGSARTGSGGRARASASRRFCRPSSESHAAAASASDSAGGSVRCAREKASRVLRLCTSACHSAQPSSRGSAGGLLLPPPPAGEEEAGRAGGRGG
mmetsp:Transcript_24059/g.79987  ORF Transcript_24059/g.79987 Transcript_24059/m.79987 type:complete len:247 (-) Transcript_24059:176-916(-)